VLDVAKPQDSAVDDVVIVHDGESQARKVLLSALLFENAIDVCGTAAAREDRQADQ
jgi:hypothetical protein